MNTFSPEGKIMVITGGTNGIGRGLVDYFVEQGVTVSVAVRKATGAILFHHVMAVTCVLRAKRAKTQSGCPTSPRSQAAASVFKAEFLHFCRFPWCPPSRGSHRQEALPLPAPPAAGPPQNPGR